MACGLTTDILILVLPFAWLPIPCAGSSLLLYAGVGFFGAALFGRSTESNIMLNALTNNPWGNLLMNGCMLFYLAAGAAACQYPLRTSIDLLLVGERVPMTVPRAVSVDNAAEGVWARVGRLHFVWSLTDMFVLCVHGMDGFGTVKWYDPVLLLHS